MGAEEETFGKEVVNLVMIKSLKEDFNRFRQDNKEEHQQFREAADNIEEGMGAIRDKLGNYVPLDAMKEFAKEIRGKEMIIRVQLTLLGMSVTTILGLLALVLK